MGQSTFLGFLSVMPAAAAGRLDLLDAVAGSQLVCHVEIALVGAFAYLVGFDVP